MFFLGGVGLVVVDGKVREERTEMGRAVDGLEGGPPAGHERTLLRARTLCLKKYRRRASRSEAVATKFEPLPSAPNFPTRGPAGRSDCNIFRIEAFWLEIRGRLYGQPAGPGPKKAFDQQAPFTESHLKLFDGKAPQRHATARSARIIMSLLVHSARWRNENRM